MSILNIDIPQTDERISYIIEKSREIFDRSSINVGLDALDPDILNKQVMHCTIISFLIKGELLHTIIFQKTSAHELIHQFKNESPEEFLMRDIRSLLMEKDDTDSLIHYFKLYRNAALFNTTNQDQLYNFLNDEITLSLVAQSYVPYTSIPRKYLHRVNIFSWVTDKFPLAKSMLHVSL